MICSDVRNVVRTIRYDTGAFKDYADIISVKIGASEKPKKNAGKNR